MFIARKQYIDGKRMERLRAWCHFGFPATASCVALRLVFMQLSTHGGVWLCAGDVKGSKQLACDIIWPPLALEKAAPGIHASRIIRSSMDIPWTSWSTRKCRAR